MEENTLATAMRAFASTAQLCSSRTAGHNARRLKMAEPDQISHEVTNTNGTNSLPAVMHDWLGHTATQVKASIDVVCVHNICPRRRPEAAPATHLVLSSFASLTHQRQHRLACWWNLPCLDRIVDSFAALS